jgi:mRNA interferase MazF
VICDRWDVVAVPFPFSERPGAKRRPALVVSNRHFNRAGHSVLCMITTQAEPPWPADYRIGDLGQAGLPVPCIVRLKLFTLDNRLLERRLGRLGKGERATVGENLASVLRD